MLQNKILFNQSSVSLEIIGLPDYSTNENEDNISIISQWKLNIIDKPVIEGNLDHLKSIMKAFYTYSNCLLNNEDANYKSKLIDIKPENFYTHNLLLKSSKPDVNALEMSIGNAVFADIINVFDKLSSSNKVKNIYSKEFNSLRNKKYKYLFFHKKNISNILLPPIYSLFSIFIISTTFIFLYDRSDNKDNQSFFNTKNKLISINPTNKIL